MKIFLLKDVPRIGSKGDIIDLAQAYAMNSFVNKGLARLATSNDEKIKLEKEKIKKEMKEKQADQSIDLMKRLEKQVLVIKKKVDSKGHLYSKVDEDEIVQAIFELEKVSLSTKSIIMEKISSLGEFTVEANVNNKKYKLNINVVKDLN